MLRRGQDSDEAGAPASPRERALPGPSTDEPAPAPGLLRAGHATVGAWECSGPLCPAVPGLSLGSGEPREPQAGLATLQALPQHLFCLGRLWATRPQACSEAPLEWPAAPCPRGTLGQLGARYDLVSGGGWPGAVGHHAPPPPVRRLVATCTKPSAPLSRLVWGGSAADPDLRPCAGSSGGTNRGGSEGREALGWGLDCSQPGHSLPEQGSRLQLRVRGTRWDGEDAVRKRGVVRMGWDVCVAGSPPRSSWGPTQPSSLSRWVSVESSDHSPRKVTVP